MVAVDSVKAFHAVAEASFDAFEAFKKFAKDSCCAEKGVCDNPRAKG
jgi:hypothetical protein